MYFVALQPSYIAVTTLLHTTLASNIQRFSSFQQVLSGFSRFSADFQQSFSRVDFCYLPRLHVFPPEAARVRPPYRQKPPLS